MITRYAGIAVALFWITSVTDGQNINLQDLRTKYDDALLVITTEQAESQSALLSAYTNSLNSLRIQMQKAGDLDKLKAIITECTRTDIEKSLPSQISDVSEIKVLEEEYGRKSQQLRVQNATKIRALASQYDTALMGLQKNLTKEGKLNEATEIQIIRKTLQNEELVTSAVALLTGGTTNQLSSNKLQPQDESGKTSKTSTFPSIQEIRSDLFYYIKSNVSGLYLEVYEKNNDIGGRVSLGKKDSAQVWQFYTSAQYPGCYHIKSNVSKLFLDVYAANKDIGGKICQAARHPPQVWRLEPSTKYPGCYHIKSNISGLYLDIDADNAKVGGNIRQAAKDPKQVWTIESTVK